VKVLEVLQRQSPVLLGVASTPLHLWRRRRTDEFEGLASAEGHSGDTGENFVAAKQVGHAVKTRRELVASISNFDAENPNCLDLDWRCRPSGLSSHRLPLSSQSTA
jgi:hypothetical protein